MVIPVGFFAGPQVSQAYGAQSGLIAKGPDGASKMLEFVWMERNWHYFITHMLSLQEGAPCS
jgi:hypothetical protein